MSLCKLVGPFAALLLSRSSVSGLDLDILTCADVQSINTALVQDHVTARFADLRCEEWQTVVAHEMDEERELRIESLPDDEGQQQHLYLKSVRFDIGRGMAVTFATDVHISRSAYHPQVGSVTYRYCCACVLGPNHIFYITNCISYFTAYENLWSTKVVGSLFL